MFDISLLGTGGMMPLPNRWLASMLFRYNGKMVLIDCGEGTQISLKQLGWGFKNIDVICFTHYHADHISGLPGLLLTLGNSGRKEPLTLIGPEGLEKVVNGLRVIAPELPYEINFIECNTEEEIVYKTEDYILKTSAVDHGVPCFAYSIETERSAKFDVNKAKELDLPKKYWGLLQKGEKVEHEDVIYFPEMVLGEKRKGIKVSYCTDSRPTEYLPEFIKNSNLFICEGMYADREKQQKAIDKKHMMFHEAAQLAKEGEVDELWLTHYSPALSNPEDELDGAKEIFPNIEAGYDRKTISLKYKD